MDAHADIEDKWAHLLTALSTAAQLRLLGSDTYERSAAIIQLKAILDFFRGTAAQSLTVPLVVLCNALQDLESGAKPPMLSPKTVKNRPPDDVVLRTAKVVAAVIMDELFEHGRLSRDKAAQEVAKIFCEYGLQNFRGRDISASIIEDWRDQAKQAAENSKLGREYKRLRSIDAQVLAQNAPLENKRDFLLKRRLPLLLIQIGAQGPKAAKVRQRMISELGRRIPKKPAC
jgi:hypothetical protein